jgi:hypothetical protein
MPAWSRRGAGDDEAFVAVMCDEEACQGKPSSETGPSWKRKVRCQSCSHPQQASGATNISTAFPFVLALSHLAAYVDKGGLCWEAFLWPQLRLPERE